MRIATTPYIVALVWNILIWTSTVFLVLSGVSPWIIIITAILHESMSDVSHRALESLSSMTCPCCAKKNEYKE